MQGDDRTARPRSRNGSSVPYGQSRAVTFEFPNLKPGVHQVEFKLAASDRLMFDNNRFLTFKVGAARLVLTIAETEEAAEFWQRGHTRQGRVRLPRRHARTT